MVNSLAEAFEKIDALGKNLSYAELYAFPAPPLPAPPLPYQFIPIGFSANVQGVKIPLSKWLGSNPDDLFPAAFNTLYEAIIPLDGPDVWASIFATPAYPLAVVAAGILVSGSYDSLFPFEDEATSLNEEIADGTIDAATNGAFSQAIDDCIDKELAES